MELCKSQLADQSWFSKNKFINLEEENIIKEKFEFSISRFLLTFHLSFNLYNIANILLCFH